MSVVRSACFVYILELRIGNDAIDVDDPNYTWLGVLDFSLYRIDNGGNSRIVGRCLREICM